MTTWKNYVGDKLTNGTYISYQLELINLINQITPEKLHIETLFPSYSEAVDLGQNLVKKVMASVHTTNIETLNKRCDQWLRSFFSIQKGFMQTPQGSETRAYAEKLKPIVSAYGKIHNEEQSSQVSKTHSLLADLESDEMAKAAVTALNLSPILEGLKADNQQLEAAIRQRNLESAAEMKSFGGLTASKQRKIINEIYKEVVRQVNAYAIVAPSEEIDDFIINAKATANYYANIAARDHGATKPELDPGNEPEEEPGTEEEGTPSGI